MSNILIINGAKKFAHSNGQLNDTLTKSRMAHCATSGMMFASFAPTATTMSKRKYKTFSGLMW